MGITHSLTATSGSTITSVGWNASHTANDANWDTAYGWGDHSTNGYVTSSGVTDHGLLTGLSDNDHPQYLLTSSASITNWDTAYGWGDHSTNGYITKIGRAHV